MIFGNIVLMDRFVIDKLYCLTLADCTFYATILATSPSLSTNSDGMKPLDIWHACLGHINYNIILAWLTIILWMAFALPKKPRVPSTLVVCLERVHGVFFPEHDFCQW